MTIRHLRAYSFLALGLMPAKLRAHAHSYPCAQKINQLSNLIFEYTFSSQLSRNVQNQTLILCLQSSTYRSRKCNLLHLFPLHSPEFS